MNDKVDVVYTGEILGNGIPLITYDKAMKLFGDKFKLKSQNIQGNTLGVVLPVEDGYGFFIATIDSKVIALNK